MNVQVELVSFHHPHPGENDTNCLGKMPSVKFSSTGSIMHSFLLERNKEISVFSGINLKML